MVGGMNAPSVRDLAKMIDHSLLHPTLTDAQLDEGCTLARRYDIATVCVKPFHVPRAANQLRGSDVKVCSVIGFPHGNSHTEIKVAETRLALQQGATEIDMVVNVGRALGGAWDYVAADVDAVNAECVRHGAALKVIFENDYLEERHIAELCRICSELRVAFVKTSTGYGFVKQASGDYNYRGATEAHLRLMRRLCPPAVQIKAAGGVRTLEDLLRVRELGVTRIGATATAAMLDAAVARFGGGPVPGAPAKEPAGY